MNIVAVGRPLSSFGGQEALCVCVLCGLLFEPQYSGDCRRLADGAWVCSRACLLAATYDYRDECRDLEGLRQRVRQG